MPECQAHVAATLTRLGFSNEEVADTMKDVHVLTEWDTVPPHLLQLITAMQRNTWASVDFAPGILLPTTGTQAGVPLADIVAMAAVSRVPRKVARTLRELQLVTQLDIQAACEFFGHDASSATTNDSYITEIGIVDDAAYPIFGDACSIIDKTSRAMTALYEIYAEHNLALNMAPTKTAAVPTYHGPGATHLKTTNPTTITVRTRWGEHTLPVVDEYKHVGSQLASGARLAPEVAQKAAIINTSTTKLRNKVLANPAIAPPIRLQLANSLLFSRALFKAATWPDLTVAEMRKFHSAIIRVYRLIINAPKWKKIKVMNDARVAANTNAPLPRHLISLYRMRLLARLVTKSPLPVLLALYWARQSKRSLATAVQADLQRSTTKLDEMQDAPFTQ
jgi:hypothetical protein